jgi:hypothetical protein
MAEHNFTLRVLKMLDTTSPSIRQDRTLRWFTASTISGKRADQPFPRRVNSRIPTRSRRVDDALGWAPLKLTMTAPNLKMRRYGRRREKAIFAPSTPFSPAGHLSSARIHLDDLGDLRALRPKASSVVRVGTHRIRLPQ